MALKRVKQGGKQNFSYPGENNAVRKLINAGDNFGNPGLKKGQGTTYVIYDFLQLTEGLNPVGTTLKFFENANNRIFPFTNLVEGKLPVGEGMVYERTWFCIMSVLNATGEVLNVQTFAEFGVPGLYKSDYTFTNANNITIKNQPLVKQKPQFNFLSRHPSNEVINLDSNITLQPLIEFSNSLRMPAVTIPVSPTIDFYMGCFAEGSGALLNPRTNF
jgi:hypothetical protein